MAGLVIVGISNLSGKPGEVLKGGGSCNVLASHPGRRGVVVIILVTLCCRNQEKVQQVGPLGLSTNFFLVQHIHCSYITLLQAFGMNPTSGE